MRCGESNYMDGVYCGTWRLGLPEKKGIFRNSFGVYEGDEMFFFCFFFFVCFTPLISF
jgi:hypothetical protein